MFTMFVAECVLGNGPGGHLLLLFVVSSNGWFGSVRFGVGRGEFLGLWRRRRWRHSNTTLCGESATEKHTQKQRTLRNYWQLYVGGCRSFVRSFVQHGPLAA